MDERADRTVADEVGIRWFRHRGALPPMDLKSGAGRYLSFDERQESSVAGKSTGCDRSPARSVAQRKSDLVAQRPQPSRLVENPKLESRVDLEATRGRFSDDETMRIGRDAIY
jgi:hypothetical protein